MVVAEQPLIDFEIPDLGEEEACLRPVKAEDPVRDQIFRNMSSTPSPEGAACDSSVSAVVSPLQSRVSASVDRLPCPERPEDRQLFTVGAPEGSPQPGGVLPAPPGVPSPAFPRVGDLMVRRSPPVSAGVTAGIT